MTEPLRPKTGEWYFGLDCEQCGRRIAIAKDTTNGDKAANFSGPGTFRIACPACRHVGDYGTDTVSSKRTA